MANTDVLLREESGLRVPSLTQVAITAGSMITFSVEEHAVSALYFAPGTVPILTPTQGTKVELEVGRTFTYTFASAAAGACRVIRQAPRDSDPTSFDFGLPADPPILVIQPDTGVDYSGPSNTPRPIV